MRRAGGMLVLDAFGPDDESAARSARENRGEKIMGGAYRSTPSVLRVPAAPVPSSPPSSSTSLTKAFQEVNINRLPVPYARPNDGQSFDFGGSIVIPAISATVFSVVFSFTVPQKKNGIIDRLANVIVGGSFQDFSGDIVWQIALNLKNPSQPLIAPNYNDITASFGAIAFPSEIAGIPVKEGQLVALLVRNNAILPAGQLIGGRFGGFFYPVAEEPPTSGL